MVVYVIGGMDVVWFEVVGLGFCFVGGIKCI